MEQQQITNIAKQMEQALSEQELLKLGQETGQCHRQRKVTPLRLALSLIQSLGSGLVESIADLRRDFNRLHGEEVQYKPFHKQLAKPSFPKFMSELCSNLMSQLAGKVLSFKPDSPFTRFQAIYLHDGSSFALKDSLQESYPGRFTKVSPAAVELHVTMDLLSEMPEIISLAADHESEVHFVPEASGMTDSLFIGDRMFFIKSYLGEIEKNRGCYIVRTKGSINPKVRHAWRQDGSEIKSWRGRSLKSLNKAMKREKAVSLDVSWSGEHSLDARLIVTWDQENKRLRYLVTNLPREVFSLDQVCDAYRLRWQIELLFKEWKSYANLHKFNTNNAFLAEGLIWASICAAILKRFLAHATERVFRVAISTRNVAMSVKGLLFGLFEAMMQNTSQLETALTRALAFLATNAKRSHPKREQKCGRAKLGLGSEYAAA